MIAQSKIDRSIALLKKAEKLALRYNDNGFYLAFSGGKDSQCIYELAKMAGVRFKAYYHNTTIDHPALLKFIRRYYPDVEWVKPKRTFFQLCRDFGIMPSAKIRFCCGYLKEGGGQGMVSITGVRRAESSRRALRNDIEIDHHKFSGSIDQFNQAFHSNDDGTFVECIKGKDKIIVNPILDWSDNDVWSFIREVRKIPYCTLYDKGYNRLGCLLCHMASIHDKRRMCKDYPNIVNAWKHTIRQIKEKRDETYGVWALDVDSIFEYEVLYRFSFKEYMASKKQLKLDL